MAEGDGLQKEYTYSDVSEHREKNDILVVIHDKVYNASSFVDEHPYVLISLTFAQAAQCRISSSAPL